MYYAIRGDLEFASLCVGSYVLGCSGVLVLVVWVWGGCYCACCYVCVRVCRCADSMLCLVLCLDGLVLVTPYVMGTGAPHLSYFFSYHF